MYTYPVQSRRLPIVGYEASDEGIVVYYEDGTTVDFTALGVGPVALAMMFKLAVTGDGLHGFIELVFPHSGDYRQRMRVLADTAMETARGPYESSGAAKRIQAKAGKPPG